MAIKGQGRGGERNTTKWSQLNKGGGGCSDYLAITNDHIIGGTWLSEP